MRPARFLIALLLLGCQPAAGLGGVGGLGGTSFILGETGGVPVDVAGQAPVAPGGATAPTLPDSVPSATPTPAPASGGGYSGPPAVPVDQGPVHGRVLGLAAAGDRPVASARVTLSDGRETLTDGDGNFTFDGAPPADGAYTVSAPAYRAATVLGLTDNPLTLHLQPRSDVLAATEAPGITTFAVTGLVLDDQGQPLADAQLVLHDARGSLGLLATSGADGSFRMTVQAVEGAVSQGSMLIRAVRGSDTYLGVAGDLALSPTQTTLAPVRLAKAPHTLRVDVSGPDLPGTPRITVTAVGAHGERLTCPVDAALAHVAALPGVRYSLDVEARDNDRGLATVLHREAIVPAFEHPETRLTADMLGLPTLTPGFGLTPGASVHWAAVQGAQGYAVNVMAEDGQAVPWDAFTAQNGLTMPPTGVPQGRARLTVTAWDQANLSTRTVASVGARRLRTLPLAGSPDFRRSTCQISQPIIP